MYRSDMNIQIPAEDFSDSLIFVQGSMGRDD